MFESTCASMLEKMVWNIMTCFKQYLAHSRHLVNVSSSDIFFSFIVEETKYFASCDLPKATSVSGRKVICLIVFFLKKNWSKIVGRWIHFVEQNWFGRWTSQNIVKLLTLGELELAYVYRCTCIPYIIQ